MTTGYTDVPAEGGGGGTGNILSINGDTSANQIISAGSGIGVVSSGGITTISNTAGVPTGTNNTFAGFDASGRLETIPGWGFIPEFMGADVGLNYQPDNVARFQNIQSFFVTIDPLQNSPDDAANALAVQMNIDPNSSGFDFGTNGTAGYLVNLGFTHNGTSNIGSLGLINGYSSIGNGTDPIDLRGYLGYSCYGDFNSGVNLTAGLQGFIFQPNVHAGVTWATSSAFSTVFADNANINPAVNGWVSFGANTHLGGVQNNNSYTAFSANPQIDSLSGNAAATMFYCGGVFSSTLGSGGGGYAGVTINPQFADLNVSSRGINISGLSTTGVAEWIGLDIETNQITTSGEVTGLRINVGNSLTKQALDITGHSTLQSNFELVSGQGQQYGNIIGGSIIIPNGTAITGTDTIANNMAFNYNLGDSGSSWTAASVVGLTGLGFVGVVSGDGDCTGGALNFCLAGFAFAANGHIERINNFAALAVNGGGTGTVDEHVLYYARLPTGNISANSWAFMAEDSPAPSTDVIESFLPRLAIGTTSRKVTNTSVGLEIGGTTKAFRASNLTTTERNALTALAGMLVFDTTLNQMAYYNGSTWAIF